MQSKCQIFCNFQTKTIADLKTKNMGILALKAMALTGLVQGEPKYYKNMWYKPVDGDDLVKLALQFTLSKKITAAIPPGKGELFLKAIDVVRDLRSNTDEENGKLLHLAADTKPLFRHG